MESVGNLEVSFPKGSTSLLSWKQDLSNRLENRSDLQQQYPHDILIHVTPLNNLKNCQGLETGGGEVTLLFST